MLIKPEKLSVGQVYYYWNKSIYDKTPTLKKCKLLILKKDNATVKRLDLSVNEVQEVKASRLLIKEEQGQLLFNKNWEA